jgi:hypothetical protein
MVKTPKKKNLLDQVGENLKHSKNADIYLKISHRQ